MVGTFFNHFIKRRYTGWWLQYNYITSAALDCGLILSTMVIFFTLYLTSANPPNWWGNFGAFNTSDWKHLAVSKSIANGTTIGPSTWN
jgi:hypothetical protein